MKFRTDAAFESSSLQGYIRITYAELCEIFGPENCDGDGYKVQAEWNIKFEDGTYATIYDWKEDVSKEQVTDWHIGGRSQQSVWAVKQAVAQAKIMA
jgi:hypothetical protein